jgi:hypothetical protein
LFEFAQASLSDKKIGKNATLHKRRFFYVSKADVNRNTVDNKYRTVPNTRKLHSLSYVGQDGRDKVRELSCYCVPCINQQYESCDNKEYVECFKDVNFLAAPVDSDEDTDIEIDIEIDNAVELGSEANVREDILVLGISSMICRDSVVAIMPSVQSLDDYYLLNVTSDGVITLEKDTESDYGIKYLKGSEEVQGLFYQFNRATKLDKKLAIVHKDSVLYVGVELSKSEKDPLFFIFLC